MQTMEAETPAAHAGPLRDCVALCLECHEAVTQCLFHCLGRGGEHASPAHIRMMMDCAEITRVAADFMLRESAQHNYTCGVCSKICEHCADDCEGLDPEDEHMRRCAEICRRCAESCYTMAAHHSPMKDGNEEARHEGH